MADLSRNGHVNISQPGGAQHPEQPPAEVDVITVLALQREEPLVHGVPGRVRRLTEVRDRVEVLNCYPPADMRQRNHLGKHTLRIGHSHQHQARVDEVK